MSKVQEAQELLAAMSRAEKAEVLKLVVQDLARLSHLPYIAP
jgi:peptidyl-tRNA hydrolase